MNCLELIVIAIGLALIGCVFLTVGGLWAIVAGIACVTGGAYFVAKSQDNDGSIWK